MDGTEARRRTAAGGKEQDGKADGDVKKATSVKSKAEPAITVVDILRIAGGLLLLNCLLSYFVTNDSVLWGWRPWFVRPAVVMRYFVRSHHNLDILPPATS